MTINENLRDWFGKGPKGGAGGGGWDRYNTKGERVGKCAREDKDGDGKGDGPKPKCLSREKAASMSKAERGASVRRKRAKDSNPDRKGAAINVNTKSKKKTTSEGKEHPKNVKGIAKELDKAVEMHKSQAKRLRKADISEGEGKKDACYHKVKASASVWPSAYASGRLVQCRKKGAKNYGKSTKKEGFLELPEFSQIQIDAMRKAGIEVEIVDEDCWDGYEKKGMKTMFGKRYPNCVKKKKTKKEEVDTEGEIINENEKECHKCLGEGCRYCDGTGTIDEAVRMPSQQGNVYLVGFQWRGKYMMMKIFFPEVKRPSRDEVQSSLEKIYPGCRVMRYDMAPYQPGDTYLNIGEELEEAAAWTKKSGKNEKGGLNEKGRKSYERENPGSDLKAPSKKVGNPRRASFCARMKGMKKKLTSSKTANDPDSRINKSLRAWNC